MTTEIGELIFENKKTLFEILDSLDVPRVSGQVDAALDRLDEVNDQLRQLGSIVDTNQANNSAAFISVNTKINAITADFEEVNGELRNLQEGVSELNTITADLQTDFDLGQLEIGRLDTKVSGFNDRISAVEQTATSLTQQIGALTTRVSTLETNSSSVSGRVFVLEANKARQQFLRRGNEYIFTYRVGNPGNTFFYRITYSGDTTIINANTGYTANVLSSQDNTTSSRTVYLAAPFDVFSSTGRYNYPMVQGPCILSFTVNNTSPTSGYITVL